MSNSCIAGSSLWCLMREVYDKFNPVLPLGCGCSSVPGTGWDLWGQLGEVVSSRNLPRLRSEFTQWLWLEKVTVPLCWDDKGTHRGDVG